MSGARPVEKPEPQNDALPARARKSSGLALGRERGPEDRATSPSGVFLGHQTVGRIHEGDGRLHVDGDVGGDRCVDQARCGLGTGAV